MAARKPAARLIVAEPPAAYRVRPPMVVDASVIGALLFSEPERDQALAWMQGKALFAPDLLDYEVANLALQEATQGTRRRVGRGGAAQLRSVRHPVTGYGRLRAGRAWP